MVSNDLMLPKQKGFSILGSKQLSTYPDASAVLLTDTCAEGNVLLSLSNTLVLISPLYSAYFKLSGKKLQMKPKIRIFVHIFKHNGCFSFSTYCCCVLSRLHSSQAVLGNPA